MDCFCLLTPCLYVPERNPFKIILNAFEIVSYLEPIQYSNKHLIDIIPDNLSVFDIDCVSISHTPKKCIQFHRRFLQSHIWIFDWTHCTRTNSKSGALWGKQFAEWWFNFERTYWNEEHSKCGKCWIKWCQSIVKCRIFSLMNSILVII